MTELLMPANGWKPRPYQRRLWEYFHKPGTKIFDGTGKRAVAICHRRWGKDDVSLHLAAKAGAVRPATYWHMLPEYEQARKAIWNAVNAHTGRRRIDEAFPEEWREKYDDRGMFIKFKWGATWQVVGSDNYQSLVGAGVAGIVFSEWSKAHPGAWGYLSPMLTENKGWAAFITTPEGKNHAHGTYQLARETPGWFAELQTVEDTYRMCMDAGIEPPMSLASVEEQRQFYHQIYGKDAGDALIDQEYWCSWQAAVLGAYWGKELEHAEREDRVCSLDVVPNYPVHKAWDIGIDDPMAIWCFQVGPGWLHIVDYFEGSGYGFDYYRDWLFERGYNGTDYVPHDAKQREPGSGRGALGARTRIETMIELGLKPVLVPDHKPIDRVNAGRRIIPRAFFDKERCKTGLEALRHYKQEWDEKNRVFRRSAKHDWASHAADAWGHLCVAVEAPDVRKEVPRKTSVEVKPLTVNDMLKRAKPERKWV